MTPPAAPIPTMPRPTPPGEVVPVKEMSEQLRKVLGLEACQGDMTLPGGRYLQHYPQVFVPDPEHPLPRELAGQEAASQRPDSCSYAVFQPTTGPQAGARRSPRTCRRASSA